MIKICENTQKKIKDIQYLWKSSTLIHFSVYLCIKAVKHLKSLYCEKFNKRLSSVLLDKITHLFDVWADCIVLYLKNIHCTNKYTQTVKLLKFQWFQSVKIVFAIKTYIKLNKYSNFSVLKSKICSLLVDYFHIFQSRKPLEIQRFDAC